MRGKNGFKALTLVLAMTLVAVACSDDGGGGSEGGTETTGEDGVIRFTFAPDPVWDYLKDSGIREEMEAESGIRIIEQASWDEFGLYAGGHADIVSITSFEVPLLEEETGNPATVFGKYNIDRSILTVRPDSDAETLEDLKGAKIAVWDTVSSTVIWGILANELYGLDFRTGGGDFELVLTDLTNTGALLASGEVDAALVLPDFNVPPLVNGDIVPLYDGRTAADPLAAQLPHHLPRAKRVIFLFMQGGVSHVDSYDYKPRLEQDDGKMMAFDDARVVANTGKRGSSQRVPAQTRPGAQSQCESQNSPSSAGGPASRMRGISHASAHAGSSATASQTTILSGTGPMRCPSMPVRGCPARRRSRCPRPGRSLRPRCRAAGTAARRR